MPSYETMRDKIRAQEAAKLARDNKAAMFVVVLFVAFNTLFWGCLASNLAN